MLPPHHHHESPSELQRLPDPGERRDRFGEEHRPESANRHVEVFSREGVGLGAGLLEVDVTQSCRFRQPTGSFDHRHGDVDTECTTGHGQATRVARRLPGTAADVEDLIPGPNTVSSAEGLVVHLQFGIVIERADSMFGYEALSSLLMPD